MAIQARAGGAKRLMSERKKLDVERAASTVDEFCARNHLCRDTAYRQIKAGKLRARKVGEANPHLYQRRAGVARQPSPARTQRVGVIDGLTQKPRRW